MKPRSVALGRIFEEREKNLFLQCQKTLRKRKGRKEAEEEEEENENEEKEKIVVVL